MRDKNITLYLTQDELNLLKLRAKAEYMDVSPYIRKQLFKLEK